MGHRNRLNIQAGQTETFHYEPAAQSGKNGGKKRAAAYCRVSTLAEEQELSFDTQRDYYTDLIGRDPEMILVGIYGDQGFSGLQSKQRREFQRMLADCEAGKIDVIFVKSLSRFSRNTVECMDYLQRLRDLGIAVFFEKEGMNSLDLQAQMALSIYASIAQNESCSLSENTRWARRQRAEMGDPVQKCCYGYRAVRQTGEIRRKWVIQEDEARRIRLMFALAHQGYSFMEIQKELNQYEAQQRSGVVWTSDRVRGALKREAYRGDILTDKMVTLDYLKKKVVKNTGQVDQFYIEQHHDPIVEPAVYDEVQEYLREGLLNGRNSQMRKNWFITHPEVLSRRGKQAGESGRIRLDKGKTGNEEAKMA